MKVAYITSDQVENSSALSGVSEKALCVPVTQAACRYTLAAGHQAIYYDPHKAYSISGAIREKPDVIILIHCDAPGHSKPQGVMGVECGHTTRDTPWAQKVISQLGQRMGWGVWKGGSAGVSTDKALRNFCFYFYKDMRDMGYQGKRLILELVNMTNREQAQYVKDNADNIGRWIAEIVTGKEVEEDMPIDKIPDRIAAPYIPKLQEAGIIDSAHEGDDAASVNLLIVMVGRLLEKLPKE